MCLMETVAYLAGEPHTDRPHCADTSIARVAMKINDCCTDELRQELLQDLPLRIIGTRSLEFENQRLEMLEQIFRYFGPDTVWVNANENEIEIHDYKLCENTRRISGVEAENLLRWAKARLDDMIALTELNEMPNGIIEPIVTGATG